MPWTVADVDKHKKGLDDKQKRRWVAVANSVLSRCMADGGSEATCAASAIRQANGVAGNSLQDNYDILTFTAAEGYQVQERVHQGRKHLVVPVTLMVEGVHAGSHGPILHTIEELGKFPESWNGIPVTVDHPMIEGQNVSANSPDVIEARTVGRIYNTHVQGTRLRAEAWLDEDRLRQVSSVTLAKVNASEPVEVSVGVFSDEDNVAGQWNDEQYNAVALNHRPDHLALLPGGTGACSLADGCGIRANNKKGGKNEMTEIKDYINGMKSYKDAGYHILEIVDNTSEGLMERLDALRAKVDAMDSQDAIHFLREAYDDHVVYEVRMRIGGTKLYKQTYQFNNGTVELTGNPVEVQRKVEYVAVNRLNFIRTKEPINLKGGKQMSDTSKCPKCLEKINALIANTASKFEEADREWLLTLNEDVLDKLAPVVETVEKIVEKSVEVNKLTPAQEADLAFVARQRAEKRTAMINSIQTDASKELWPDDVLNALTEDHLERIFKSVKKEESPENANYVLNGAGNAFQANAAVEVEPLLPTGIEFEVKK